MCAARARTSNLRDAVEWLGLAFDAPVEGEDVYVIHGFAQHFALDPKASMHRLRDEYPHRSGEDEIPWGEAQWVSGDHMALRYRGNVLTRTKMWFQESDPMENVKGFLKYFYTGWQYKVMPATAGVEPGHSDEQPRVGHAARERGGGERGEGSRGGGRHVDE